MLISRQIRAARGLLGWSARQLADRAGVHITTVQRIEASKGQLRGTAQTLAKLERALEAAGIEFLDEEGVGPGVRLTKPRRPPRRAGASLERRRNR